MARERRINFQQREVYGGESSAGQSLLPEIVTLGWDRFTRAKPQGLDSHRHDAYEICLLCDGAADWWVENERVSLRRGEIYFTRPGERHGGADAVMHPCEIFWLIVPLVEPPGIADAMNADGPRHFPAPLSAEEDFVRLIAAHRGPDQPFASLAARASLYHLLVEVARERAAFAALNPNENAALSPAIAAALRWMEERLGEPFCIQDAAAAVGMHPSRFHERFVAEINDTPAEWRTRQRIALARRLLSAPDARITEVAFAAGFPSSQHFATTFKKYTGRTPTEFRRAK